jgi:hypothetical protein
MICSRLFWSRESESSVISVTSRFRAIAGNIQETTNFVEGSYDWLRSTMVVTQMLIQVRLENSSCVSAKTGDTPRLLLDCSVLFVAW